jgi:hypothetical protein
MFTRSPVLIMSLSIQTTSSLSLVIRPVKKMLFPFLGIKKRISLHSSHFLSRRPVQRISLLFPCYKTSKEDARPISCQEDPSKGHPYSFHVIRPERRCSSHFLSRRPVQRISLLFPCYKTRKTLVPFLVKKTRPKDILTLSML